MLSKLNALGPLLSKLAVFINKNKPPAGGPVAPQESRPMKFPYTFAAKIAQFPYKYHFNNNWIYRYYAYGVILSMPVFMYISRLSNSPGSKAKWAEYKRKEREEYEHRFS